MLHQIHVFRNHFSAPETLRQRCVQDLQILLVRETVNGLVQSQLAAATSTDMKLVTVDVWCSQLFGNFNHQASSQ